MSRLVLAATLALAGCLPVLSTQSAQPPGRVARLDELRGFWGLQGYKLELSQGSAIALTCYYSGPCKQLSVVSADPAIAEIRRASLGTLQPSGFANTSSAAALVIVGKAAGQTRVTVKTSDGDRVVPVTVIPQPGAIVQQATR